MKGENVQQLKMRGGKPLVQLELQYFFQLQEKCSGSARKLEWEQVWVTQASQRQIL